MSAADFSDYPHVWLLIKIMSFRMASELTKRFQKLQEERTRTFHELGTI